MPISSLANIFKIMMRVLLLYACEVSYPINVADRVRLERSQKFACKLFLRNFDYNTSYLDLYSGQNLQPLWHTVFTRRLSLIHAYILSARHFPPGFLVLLRDSAQRSSARTNHNNTIILPRYTIHRSVCSALVSS